MAGAAAIVLAFSSIGAAQDAATPLRVGDRVRYRMGKGDPLITARVIEILGGSLLVEAEKGRGSIRLHESRLERLDVARGKRSHWRLGAIVGGGTGAAAGGFFGYVAGALDETQSIQPAEGLLVGAAIVGAAGALVGAAIGSAFKTDRWEPQRRRQVALTLVPTRGRGLAGAVSVRF
jgi:hypothetical protein